MRKAMTVSAIMEQMCLSYYQVDPQRREIIYARSEDNVFRRYRIGSRKDDQHRWLEALNQLCIIPLPRIDSRGTRSAVYFQHALCCIQNRRTGLSATYGVPVDNEHYRARPSTSGGILFDSILIDLTRVEAFVTQGGFRFQYVGPLGVGHVAPASYYRLPIMAANASYQATLDQMGLASLMVMPSGKPAASTGWLQALGHPPSDKSLRRLAKVSRTVPMLPKIISTQKGITLGILWP